MPRSIPAAQPPGNHGTSEFFHERRGVLRRSWCFRPLALWRRLISTTIPPWWKRIPEYAGTAPERCRVRVYVSVCNPSERDSVTLGLPLRKIETPPHFRSGGVSPCLSYGGPTRTRTWDRPVMSRWNSALVPHRIGRLSNRLTATGCLTGCGLLNRRFQVNRLRFSLPVEPTA